MSKMTFMTGAGGFVGRHLTPLLSGVPAPPDLELRSPDAIGKVLKTVRPDWVVHLAAQSFVGASFENPRETFDINFTGTLNLLEALDAIGFRGRMLFVGSGDTYGRVPEDSLPVNENMPVRPRNPYAVSKVAAEALCYQWSQTCGFEIVMTRSFNHIGPGQSAHFAISDFARQIVEIQMGRCKPELAVGDIDVTRDFTDVRDVAQAYVRLLVGGRNGEVYNVCSGVERTVRSLVDSMIAMTGIPISVTTDPSRMRPAEQRRMVGDYAKIQRETGWKPGIPVEKTLGDLMNDWETRIG